MPIGLVYAALFSLGAGASILGFWSIVLIRDLLPKLLPGPGARDHVIAELITATLLLASGGLLLAEHDTSWVRALAGVALGGLVYALTASRGMYPPEQRAVRGALLLGWVFTIPAIIALLMNA